MAHGQTFLPVDLKRRISQKVPRGGPDRTPLPAGEGDGGGGEGRRQLPDVGLEVSPVPQLLVDVSGVVAAINERARTLFGLRPGDVGRPLRDLQISYRPADLRSLIDQATAERRPIAVKEVEWRAPSGESRWLDVQVAPLRDASVGDLGVLIAYSDVTGYRRLTRELEQSHQELETAYEELQSTNEELETTNEELQSTVEELETTNEELQSTNEELETMNEELQSTNEELQTINDELRQRGEELNAANAFLQSVMTSLRGGVAVVDRELRLLAWSRHAEELWGLRTGGGLRTPPPQPRHGSAGRAASARPQGVPVGRLGDRAGGARRGEPPGQDDPVYRDLHAAHGRQERSPGRHSAHGGDPARLLKRSAHPVHLPPIQASPASLSGELALPPAGQRPKLMTHSWSGPAPRRPQHWPTKRFRSVR